MSWMNLVGWTTSLQPVEHGFEVVFSSFPGFSSGTFPQSGIDYPRFRGCSCSGDDMTEVTQLPYAINQGDPQAAHLQAER